MKKYQDLDLNLKIHPLSNDLVLANDANAIRNAVKYLCLYGPFDQPYKFGTQYAGLYEYLFSLSTSRTLKSMIYTKLVNLVNTYEPRVTVNDIDVEINEAENGFSASVLYTIKSTGLNDNVRFTVVRTS